MGAFHPFMDGIRQGRRGLCAPCLRTFERPPSRLGAASRNGPITIYLPYFEGVFLLLAFRVGALDPAAFPVRPAHEAGMEIDASYRTFEPACDWCLDTDAKVIFLTFFNLSLHRRKIRDSQ
jgi:hypothetical protein